MGVDPIGGRTPLPAPNQGKSIRPDEFRLEFRAAGLLVAGKTCEELPLPA